MLNDLPYATGAMSNYKRTWSKDEIEEVRQLAAQGRTAGEITNSIHSDRTRNAIIGLCHREGIKFGRSPKPEKEPKKGRQPKRIPILPMIQYTVRPEVK